MITVRRYTKKDSSQWNAFVKQAKNGLFLFDRAYMEYHADRFVDHSMLFFENQRRIALLPANEKGEVLYSHQGLTFGGVISDSHMTTVRMLEIFRTLIAYGKTHHFRTIIYKAIPYVYHQIPAQEDLYALYRYNARLIGRDIASVVISGEPRFFAKGIKDSLRKARTAGLTIKETRDFATFMNIAKDVIRTKYHATPTHTAAEIQLLASRFPQSIRLFMAYQRRKALGGTMVYEHPSVAHTQYIAATDTGKKLGAISAVIDYCISKVYGKKQYFSFGKSTEQMGAYLNEGLIQNKEHYGGRGVVHDTYELPLS